MTASELLLEAISLGLTCENLDELVHSEAERRASAEINELADGEDHKAEAIYDSAAAEASDINNDGLEAQIKYLLQTSNAAAVKADLTALGKTVNG